MDQKLKNKILATCDHKIQSKGDNVGISFYAFFSNKNDDPETLMEVAKWWIQVHKLDHFEKATRIKSLVLRNEH